MCLLKTNNYDFKFNILPLNKLYLRNHLKVNNMLYSKYHFQTLDKNEYLSRSNDVHVIESSTNTYNSL